MIFRYVIMVCMVALLGCSTRLPTFRYRLTVEIETPARLRTGSSVIEVRTVDRGRGFPGPEAGGIRHGVVGDAIYLKLPDGRYIFAILQDNGPNPTNFPSAAPFWAFDNQLPADRSNYHQVHRALTQAEGKAVLLPEHYPAFVMFENIMQPQTVQSVSPDNFKNELGVELRSVTVEITDDPVEDDIASILPWATPQKMKTMLDGSRIRNSSELANEISLRSFRLYDPEKL